MNNNSNINNSVGRVKSQGTEDSWDVIVSDRAADVVMSSM